MHSIFSGRLYLVFVFFILMVWQKLQNFQIEITDYFLVCVVVVVIVIVIMVIIVVVVVGNLNIYIYKFEFGLFCCYFFSFFMNFFCVRTDSQIWFCCEALPLLLLLLLITLLLLLVIQMLLLLLLLLCYTESVGIHF